MNSCWPVVPLSELCEVEGGNAAPQGAQHYEGGTLPFVRMKDLGRYHLTDNLIETDDRVTSAAQESHRLKVFEPGCILFPRSGSVFLNHRAILGIRAAVVSHIGILSGFREKVLPKYLYRYLQTFEMTALSKKTTGVDSIAFSDVKRIPVPVPPLEEQERIVKLLDAADELQKLRQQANQRTADLIPAIFHDMFGDPAINPNGWPVHRLGSLTSRITKGESPHWQGFTYVENGIPFITSENVLWGKINLEGVKNISPDFHFKLRRSVVKPGDVLVNLVGASIGRSAVMSPDVEEGNVNQAVAVITLNQQLIPQFLLQTILSEHIQAVLHKGKVDSARANISLTDLRELLIMVPPLKLQREFAKVDAATREMAAKQSEATGRMDDLFQSLLHRAFEGEL